MDKEDLSYYEGYGSRPRSLRPHWINCCLQPEQEVIEIDRMEDELAVGERQRALPIRRLITRFENCHWNSDRWLERILQAIGEERVPPTSGRPRAQHLLAQMLQCLRDLLTHWVARSTALVPQCTVLDKSSTEIVRIGSCPLPSAVTSHAAGSAGTSRWLLQSSSTSASLRRALHLKTE
jgi:hypothetical protein